jgi:hypothetical protein
LDGIEKLSLEDVANAHDMLSAEQDAELEMRRKSQKK